MHGIFVFASRRDLVACGGEIWEQDLWKAACRKRGLSIDISEHTPLPCMYDGPRSWALVQAKPGKLGTRSHPGKSATGSHVWGWVQVDPNFWCSLAAFSAPRLSLHLDLFPLRPASSFIAAPSHNLQDGHQQPQATVSKNTHGENLSHL